MEATLVLRALQIGRNLFVRSVKGLTARDGGPFEAQGGEGRRTPKKGVEVSKKKNSDFLGIRYIKAHF